MVVGDASFDSVDRFSYGFTPMRICRLDCSQPEIVRAVIRLEKAAYGIEVGIIGYQNLL